jgi:hypothetical protein
MILTYVGTWTLETALICLLANWLQWNAYQQPYLPLPSLCLVTEQTAFM